MKKQNIVLVCSGGGSKGSYQTGVIKALTEHGRNWNAIAGVSVGALNATALAMCKPEDQYKGALELEKLWFEDIKGSHSIYRKWVPWIFNYVASLFKGSLYNTKPLYEILKRRFNREKLNNSGVQLRIGAVGLKTGLYKSATEKEENILEWILASSTMPILFQPVEISGDKWVDGGVRNIIPINDVLELNPTEIDVVLSDPFVNYKFSFSKFNSVLDVAKRSLELMVNEIYLTDISNRIEKEYNIKVNIYQPSKMLEYDAFDFNPKYIKESIDMGYKETKEKLLSEKDLTSSAIQLSNTNKKCKKICCKCEE